MNIFEQLKIQKDFTQIKQSIWLDSISRDMILSNSLKNIIEKLGVSGLTSNPTIFEEAIATSNSYDKSMKIYIKENKSIEEIAYSLMIEDIMRVCDLFMDIYNKSNKDDGYVSIEIPPDVEKKEDIISCARDLNSKINRPNIMIKVPATDEGIEAMEELIKDGININMTLIFSPYVYEKVAKSYIKAVEYRLNNNLNPEFFSVASFFVSRIDTLCDQRLEKLSDITENIEKKSTILSLRGKAGISTALLAYSKYKELFFGENFKSFREKGFKPQKILWASTSTKNPAYRDTLYADELCLSDSINTLPLKTLYAFLEHGNINRVPLDKRIKDAIINIDAIKKYLDLDEIYSSLLTDGLVKFKKSYDNILKTIEDKIKKLSPDIKTIIQIYNSDISKQEEELKNVKFIERLYKKDPSLWKTQKDHSKIIKNSLGWLEIAGKMEKEIEELIKFKDEIVREKKFKYSLILGMGGSSLAPEVFRSLFEKDAFLKTYIIDTTNPDWISDVEKKINLRETLFIFSSKSGSTIEPNSQFKYFYNKLKKLTKKPGENFIAITDKNTSLEKLAREYSFRKVFINPSDIGGRFSAFSYFGMVVAALLGIDIKKLIEKVIKATNKTKNNEPVSTITGCFISSNYLNGRDKLTIILPEKLKRFGLWIEQLIAESTGKEGKGIVPVIDTMIIDPHYYDKDRMFIIIQFADYPDQEIEEKTTALISNNFPVLKIYINEIYDIFEQFYFFEIATAIAGYFMKINPFDQPDVASSKEITKRLLEKDIPLKPSFVFRNLEVYTANLNIENPSDIEDILWQLTKEKKEDTYYSIMAYLNETKEITSILKNLASFFTISTNSASIYSYGPRYLHSLGQLFKGGKDNGIFIILTSKSKKDIKILGEHYSFYRLCISQAKGDFIALRDKGRKAIMIFNKTKEYEKEFKKIINNLCKLITNFEEGNMPKTATKNKKETTKQVEDGYIVIDYPKHMETITSRHYTIRIGASETNRVEVSIDNGPWQSARHSVGYWWYDWNNITPGTHEIIAKMYKNNGSFLISKRRRCKVI